MTKSRRDQLAPSLPGPAFEEPRPRAAIVDHEVPIVRGREAVEAVLGRRTEGFRAPCHAINRDTVTILNSKGFRFDANGLYYRHDMGKVVEVGPSRFREWTGLYERLDLAPRFGWDLLRVLLFWHDPLVIPVHPHYSGQNEGFAAALEGFLACAERHSARCLTIPAYLDAHPEYCHS